MLRKEIVYKLHDIRKSRKVSMREIQTKTGLAIATISEFENLNKDMTLERFLKFLDALELQLMIVPKKQNIQAIKEASNKLLKLL